LHARGDFFWISISNFFGGLGSQFAKKGSHVSSKNFEANVHWDVTRRNMYLRLRNYRTLWNSDVKGKELKRGVYTIYFQSVSLYRKCLLVLLFCNSANPEFAIHFSSSYNQSLAFRIAVIAAISTLTYKRGERIHSVVYIDLTHLLRSYAFKKGILALYSHWN